MVSPKNFVANHLELPRFGKGRCDSRKIPQTCLILKK